ncbi:MAG: hypothetical protein ACR2KS_10140 [Candidatus Eremiobacter antarcticus]|nr:hypothetical protein [Candidatus Eremiobacteraeota bacterium]MBC5808793.1 hypothetical protein [Candidatus Eremiobacteraeota bacterium]
MEIGTIIVVAIIALIASEGICAAVRLSRLEDKRLAAQLRGKDDYS